MKFNVLCDACNHVFSLSVEDETNLPKDRIVIEDTIRGIHRRYICDKCYQDNYKFTEHGVLMYEAPSRKRRKDKYGT